MSPLAARADGERDASLLFRGPGGGGTVAVCSCNTSVGGGGRGVDTGEAIHY